MSNSNGTGGMLRRVGLVLGPILFLVVLSLPTPEDLPEAAQRAGAVAVLMATWWLTEALPLPATSLLPIALFPLLDILPGDDVTLAYANDIIFLFAGGFFISMAIQKWNLHERIALNIVSRAGENMSGMVLGFMISSALLSMWISNTATALMMMPIAMAVITQLEKQSGEKAVASLAACLLLGIAYACTVGGIATIIGTPPNGVFVSQLGTLFPDAPDVPFLRWMYIGLPISIVLLPIVWLMLTRLLFRMPDLGSHQARDEVSSRLAALGPMTRGERTVAIVAGLTALSWIFRANIEIGVVTIPGWSNVFPNPDFIEDSTVAIFFTVVLFLTPVDWKKGEFALDWEWAKRIPWGLLLLFGGGLALADAFRDTGLVEWLGQQLTQLSTLPPILLVASIALMMTFVTELTSNTATTTIMLPILAAGATAIEQNPLLLMIPATLSASCAFMMPVATPPNAVVFGSGRLTIMQMAKAGILINLVGAVLITLLTYFVAVPIFNVEVGVMPDWAASGP